MIIFMLIIFTYIYYLFYHHLFIPRITSVVFWFLELGRTSYMDMGLEGVGSLPIID